MSLSVLKYPDAALKKRAAPVDKIGDDIFRLVEEMITVMLKEDGLGLAANQVGSGLKIFVLNTAPNEDRPETIACINPVVLDAEGEKVDEEGCLSFPELYLKIARPEKVRVYAKSLFNEEFVLDLEGILARAVMHEMDHLNGILFIERAAAEEKGKIDQYLEGITNKV